MDITKRLRKIEKSEEKALKILCKQRKDLIKALEDTDKLIIKKIDKGTPEEAKLEAEIEKLAQRLDSMRGEMAQIREKREVQVRPLRRRSEELRQKLKLVDSQIGSTHELRERRLTRGFEELDESEASPNAEQFNQRSSFHEDFSPSSPPPYSPY